jgi:PAS domain S-box-containing protein
MAIKGNLTLLHRGLILVGVPLLTGIIIMTSLACVVTNIDHDVTEGNTFKQIERDCSILIMTLYHLGYVISASIRGSELSELTKLPEGLRTIIKLRNEVSELVQPYKSRFKDDPVESLNKGLKNIAIIVKPFFQPHRGLQFRHITAFDDRRKQLGKDLDEAYFLFQGLLTYSQNEMVEANWNKQNWLLGSYAFILLAGLIGSVGLAFFLARSFMFGIVRRLAVITENSKRLASDLPLNDPVDGSDEIFEVDKAFHEMADAVRQTAERERALFDNASDVICVLDGRGHFSRVNPASLKVWGVRPEELIDHPLMELIALEEREAVARAVAGAQSGSPSAEFECQVLCRGQEPMETLWSVYWSESEESLFCVVHDISERKKLERMKQEFLAMVSHDLRSPLTSITGVFELLARGKYGELPAAAGEKVGMARRNVSRLLSMVNDLLDMEKLEAGQLDLTLEPVDINDLLERCIEEASTVAESRKVNLVLKPATGKAEIDSDRMIQVIVNLLSNAIKFSPEGGDVTLAGKVSGDELEVSVTDQGRGVPEKYREAIFERFKQVEASDGKRKAGTGLGLPICKQLVELHGGKIGVDSEEGKGSKFWIRLPLAPKVVQVEELSPTVRMAAYEGGKQLAISLQPAKPEKVSSPRKSRFFNPQTDLSILQKGIVLVAMPVLLEFMLVGSLAVVLMQTYKIQMYEHHLHAITYAATELVAAFMKVGRAVSGDQTPKAWIDFCHASEDSHESYNRLKKVSSSDALLSAEVAAIDQMAQPALQFIDKSRKFMEGKQLTPENIGDAWEDRVATETFADRLAQSLIGLLDKSGQLQSTDPQQLAVLHKQQGRLLVAGVAFNIVLAILLVIFFVRGITSRLAVLKENELRLARELDLRPVLSGRDEIAQLDEVFHSMAQTLREARKKERAVFDNSQDVICALDCDGVFRQINSACVRLWGYQPDQLLNSSVYGLADPENHERFSEILQARQTGSIVYLENRTFAKDGTVHEILWSANWSDERQLWFCVAHDISKRKELERLKHDFLAMVSHDLRTPLTAVAGVAKLMVAGAFGQLPDLAYQKLQIVVKNVDRLLNLINDLLDIEKLDAGQMQLTLEPTSIKSVLERSCQSLEGFAREKNVEMVVQASDAQVAIDGDRLIQAIVNLLSNSIKFSPDGGTVLVSAELADGQCTVRVRDQGRGVPEEYKKTIFERFKQVEAADGKRSKGTGLGLPITKKIVEAHGGTIGVDSEPGVGSTFWFRIPVTKTVVATERQVTS